MLCRNLFFLKSNQYSRSVSDRSWYIFVCCISLFAIKFTPHFSLRKFLGKRRFPQILKLPFFQYLQYFQPLLCCIFRPRITGTWQGLKWLSLSPCRAVRRVPLTPVFPHSRGTDRDIPGTAMRQSCVAKNVSQKFLIRNLAAEKMKYIIPGHPASCTYHTKSSTCVYT